MQSLTKMCDCVVADVNQLIPVVADANLQTRTDVDTKMSASVHPLVQYEINVQKC